jgi:hypothetical protein
MRSLVALIAIAGCGGADVSREIGARCDRANECDDRCLGPSGDFPDGFCTIDCSDNRDCPDDTACVTREGGVCLIVCLDTTDCEFLGPTWTCHDDKLRENDDPVSICRG